MKKLMELVEKPGCKSEVWKYFGLKCDEEKRPVMDGYAFCRECKNKVAARSGNTSNLIAHLRNNHPTIYAAFSKQKTETAKHNESSKSAASGASQQKSITEALVSSQPYDRKSKKWMELTNSVTFCIAKDMLPMYSVEKPGFRRMLATFDKRYEPLSRSYISKVAIPRAYNITKQRVVNDLSRIEYFLATTDCWSSQGMKPYLSYTIHYIDHEWAIKSCCLQTVYLPEDHTANNLAESLEETLRSWSLDVTRQTCITTDSASNIKRATEDLGWRHISCFGHNLNLAVSKALKDNRCLPTIGACRKLVSAFSMSWKRRRDLSSTQVTMKLPQHSLSADCVTRWGSTGKMVGRIREQQEAINFVLGNDRKASHLVLNWQQKDVLEAIDNTLSPLKKMTDLLSGEDYVTISAIKPMLHHIF